MTAKTPYFLIGTSVDDISTTTELDSIVQIGSGAVDTSNSPEFMSATKLGEFDIFSGNVISGGNDALKAIVTGTEDITQYADNGWVGLIGDVSQSTVRLDLFIGDILAWADPFANHIEAKERLIRPLPRSCP